MNSEIKDYIINNFKDDDMEMVKDAILDSLKENDEVTLPGLGVFFLLNWEEADDLEKDKIVERVYKQIKKGS